MLRPGGHATVRAVHRSLRPLRPGPGDPPPPEAFARRGTVGAVVSPLDLFVQVRDFLTALATRRPLVSLLDDLQWADPASLDLLRYLARGLEALPVILLVTYRSDELRRHPLYALLPQLSREAGAVRLELGGLDEVAVRALVAARYELPNHDAARLPPMSRAELRETPCSSAKCCVPSKRPARWPGKPGPGGWAPWREPRFRRCCDR